MRETIRTWAEIDTGALVHNLQYGRQLTGKKVMCVIKGDAHGHGAAACGRALEENGADAFAVACLSEGIALRGSGIKAPILILGWTPAECAGELAEYRLTQSVFDEGYAQDLNEALQRLGARLDVHIKLDTGMSRTGLLAQGDPVPPAEAAARIADLPSLRVTGIFTHFAAADMPEKDEFTAWQLDNYRGVLAELEGRGACLGAVRHAANSAGILYHPETYFDMVRMGVMMYGLYPNGVFAPDGPLRQALTLKSRVVQVKELPAGACISYGCTVKTQRPMRIAVVGAGYADAYPRRLSNRGAYAVINGSRCPQIGRVCMDLCMFDATETQVRQGDIVILYGKGGMALEEAAGLAGSINCEITSVLTSRVRKVYL